MTTYTVIVFALVYIAMALGTVPGFKVDRAGAALIGALALQVAGRDRGEGRLAVGRLQHHGADLRADGGLGPVHHVGLLHAVTARLAAVRASPEALLAVIVVAVGALSAFLTNNVVAVAMAPLLVNACGARKLNPVPFLLALGFAANAGSVATIIGSPQNMIVAQRLDLPFLDYTRATIVPALFALATIWVRAGAPLPGAMDARDRGRRGRRWRCRSTATRR